MPVHGELLGQVVELVPGVVGLVGGRIGDLGEGEETQHPTRVPGRRNARLCGRWQRRRRLLSGLRVLDLSIWRPGPYATSLLVALGADVLKVEPPGGDPMRHYAGLFESINAGKRSIVLDLKDGAGRDRALALAEQADVLVEGFRPGVMARLGMDEATVRLPQPGPRLLLHLGLRPGGRARRAPRARRQLPGLGRRADPRRGHGDAAAPADGRPGVRPDRRLRHLCGGHRPRVPPGRGPTSTSP